MKNHLSAVFGKTLRNKGARAILPALLLSFLLGSVNPGQAQALAIWGFNGNNNGTAGAYNSLYPAVFSPAVTGPAYNPSVFYGEGVWPAGGLDPAWYFEFGVAPLSGNSLNISSLAITMRRSSTGSAGGGPNNWVLRSNSDGYTSDLASGTLTTGAVTYNVSPGPSFLSLLTGRRFRIYGYNASLSSGALSRLVMENIQINGIGTILPARILNFGAMLRGKETRINYRVATDEAGVSSVIERSVNGTDYKEIDRSSPSFNAEDYRREYADAVAPLAGQIVYYRLKLVYRSGQQVYSSVAAVDLTQVQPVNLTLIRQGNTLLVRPAISGATQVAVYTTGGQLLRQARSNGNNSLLSVELPGQLHGLLLVQVSNGRETENGKLFIP
ncbi:MAG: hypothetical protein EOO09_19570 [Chitinophagaceae bacterium]|nr:MAG: hypothetical protein EOO09_19570 [Chitinophagaceae bacterium]